MSIKYHLAQDALNKIGLNKAIRRSILNYFGELAQDAEVIEPTPLPEQSNQPKPDPQ